ncbi:hypothetical protein ZWY2020_046689 [Hordeum vulgare]|nr:hypothetical protein ZWY2020_046689 [Hordeum vulgare]
METLASPPVQMDEEHDVTAPADRLSFNFVSSVVTHWRVHVRGRSPISYSCVPRPRPAHAPLPAGVYIERVVCTQLNGSTNRDNSGIPLQQRLPSPSSCSSMALDCRALPQPTAACVAAVEVARPWSGDNGALRRGGKGTCCREAPSRWTCRCCGMTRGG